MLSPPSTASTTPSSSQGTQCPICNQFIPGTPSQVQAHVEQHLDTTPPSDSRSLIDKPLDQVHNLSPAEKMMLEVEQGDYALALHLASTPTSLSSNSPKLSTSLSETADRCYTSILPTIIALHNNGDSNSPFAPGPRPRLHLATPLDFYVSNIAGLGWDCGYRNIQTMFSALLKDPLCCSALRRKGIIEVPSILEIAAGIEEAWQNGIDREGANNFDGRLMGRQVWIGAMEAQAILTNNGIRALIEDFETPTLSDRERMFEWVYHHFERFCASQNCSIHRKTEMNNSIGCLSVVAPMFCQYPGHSVTVVGAKRSKSTGNVSLVILDPTKACSNNSMVNPVSLDVFTRDARHPEWMHPRYQIVYIPSLPPRPPSASSHLGAPQPNESGPDNESHRKKGGNTWLRSLLGKRHGR